MAWTVKRIQEGDYGGGIWKDSEEEEYWTTIGIGVKDYYKEV